MPDATPSKFAKRLASISQGEHDQFHLIHETDPPLSGQIKKYWTTLGLHFPGVQTPWSAVFISFCVKTAGATSAEFKFAESHSVFVHKAIENAMNQAGVFQGFDIREKPIALGDILQNSRSGHHFDFAFAKAHAAYESHSAIVVSMGHDALGSFAMTVGGNESDSIRMKRVNLKPDGTVKQRASSPFICLVKNLK